MPSLGWVRIELLDRNAHPLEAAYPLAFTVPRLYGLSEVPWGRSRSTTPSERPCLLWACAPCRCHTMKFAKRLAAEASRKSCFAAAYLDYRTLKKTIKDDISCSGEIIFAGASLPRSIERLRSVMLSMLSGQRAVVESLKYPAWRVPTPSVAAQTSTQLRSSNCYNRSYVKCRSFTRSARTRSRWVAPGRQQPCCWAGPAARHTPARPPRPQPRHPVVFAKRFMFDMTRLTTSCTHSSQPYAVSFGCSCRPPYVRYATAAGLAPACSSSHSCGRRSRS